MRFQQNVGYFVIILGSVVLFSIWKANETISSKGDLLKYFVGDPILNRPLIAQESEMGEVTAESEEDLEDDVEPKLYFRYKPPPNAGLTALGKTFKIPRDVAHATADLISHFVTLTPETLQNFAFVMAASENHVLETKDGIAAIQFHFPGKPIYYYDLGLNQAQIEEISAMKDVKLRTFNFSMYPAYFEENLRMCVWKPFIIRDILKEHGGVFWMDASIRLHTNNFTEVNQLLLENDGMVLFKSTAHSNFAGTHKGTYDYIPTRRVKQQQIYMQCAAAMFIFNTKPLFYNVLWWWFLCAYEEKCQIPMPKTMCVFPEERRMETFADCHKWDQSTINILLSNFHGYNMSKYAVPEEKEILTIERWPTNYYEIKVDSQE